MRKSGARPAAVRPTGAAQDAAAPVRAGFSGLKIQSAPKTAGRVNGRPSAFGEEASGRAAAGSIGVEMALSETQQGSTIIGQGEKEAEAPLVIPAKRNGDWMKRKEQQGPDRRRAATDQLRDEAINELVGGGETREGRELVIAARSQAGREESAFADDIGEYSDVSDDAYERVPVEEFGAAMLRGMGWTGDTGGSGGGSSHSEAASQRRPGLLGLGAKPLPEELQPKPSKPRAKRY